MAVAKASIFSPILDGNDLDRIDNNNNGNYNTISKT